MRKRRRYFNALILVLVIVSSPLLLRFSSDEPVAALSEQGAPESSTSYYYYPNSTIGGPGKASMYPYGVGVDSAGYIYVADTFNHRILKFYPNGSLASEWGGQGSENGKLRKPHGLAVETDGYVYVADTGNHRVQKFNSNGTWLWTTESSEYEFSQPLGVAVTRDVATDYDGDSYFYVTDRPSGVITKWNASDGTFILKWGSEEGPGHLSDPRGITVDSDGNVYVVDMVDTCVKKYYPNGTFTGIRWGEKGEGDEGFMKPKGIHVDANDYVYVADSFNHRIKKYDTSKGTSNGTLVKTWGNFSMPPTNYSFFVPRFLAIDSESNLYICDSWNYRVQKFDSNGTFLMSIPYPVGGTPPPDGLFSGPYDVTVDDEGNIFVVEAENMRVQKFDKHHDFVLKWGYRSPDHTAKNEEWPGTFNYPHHLVTDSEGNVYVSDRFNHRIQVFNKNGSFLRMWGSWGTNPGEFKSPEGIAVSNDGYVYVADCRNNRVQKFNSTGHPIITIGNLTSGDNPGQFDWPEGIAVDSVGNIYVADTGNHRIQKFDPNGTFITEWGEKGSYPSQFDTPSDVDVDLERNVYVVDKNNARIQIFDSNGSYVLDFGSYGTGYRQFKMPTGIDVDSFGNIYVADQGNNRVQVWVPQGPEPYVPEYISTIGGYGAASMYPYGIDIAAAGDVYIMDEYQHRMLKYDSNGSFLLEWGEFGPGDGQFKLAKGVAYYNGSVYVADKYNHRVQVFDYNGNFMFKWGLKGTGVGQFKQPDSIAVDSNASVYVTECQNNRVQKFDSNGNFITTWGTQGSEPGEFLSPRGIAVDSEDYVYVADVNNHRIQKFDSKGNFITTWGRKGNKTDPPQFEKPYAIAIDEIGYVYVADTWNHRIMKFNSTGGFVTSWGRYGNETGEFHGPKGVTVDTEGNVYVSDQWNYRVQKFTSDGVFTSIFGGVESPKGLFLDPRSASVGLNGSVYVMEAWSHRFQKFDLYGNFIYAVGQPPPEFCATKCMHNGTFNYPKGVAVNATGYVYVADSQNHRIQVFDSNGNFLFKWGSLGGDRGQFRRPEQLAIGPDGSVYVTDVRNYRVQKFSSEGTWLLSWGGESAGGIDAEDGKFNTLRGIAVDEKGCVYVADPWNHRIQKFDSEGNFITKWGGRGSGPGLFEPPGYDSADATGFGLAVDNVGRVYVADTGNHRIQVFDSNGNFLFKWGSIGSNAHYEFLNPSGVAVDSTGNITRVYVADTYNHRVQKYRVESILPKASFTYTPEFPMEGEEMQFNDTSSSSEGPIVSWLWTFGDGENSTLQNPTHTYMNHGTYMVTLKVWDVVGNTNFTTASVTVFQEGVFGHVGISSKTHNLGHTIRGTWFTCPRNSTAQSITVYIEAMNTKKSVKCAIYRRSDNSLVGVTEEKTVYVAEGAHWETFSFSDPKPALDEGIEYYLVAWAGGWCRIYYDLTGNLIGGEQAYTFNGFPSPWNPTPAYMKNSIYCNITS